ncbi:hypothetical protein [Tepidibacillus fermentans]|uniref:Prenylated flavin chaperone LpdD-like domain-containing protein n=1 Tax=Tepidibacillus fermentans TaxID=1281767 RepID=A0A4R3KDY1_9BACI|nr:hypothetical protein [Tepidibacillus fermentans]TCS81305.1 hypothetical protein EDD72_11364 [Tepidibacillus fermentans]
MTNPYQIQIQHFKMGEDLVILVSGGVAHIGAVATAYVNENKIHVEVTQLPHHKEGELAREFAELAAQTLHRTVSVLMGIHIHQATKDDICQIEAYVRNAMKQIIKALE